MNPDPVPVSERPTPGAWGGFRRARGGVVRDEAQPPGARGGGGRGGACPVAASGLFPTGRRTSRPGGPAMTGTLYGLGVGPGDPELVTLKAARSLAGWT
jgi:hypothetical protein